MIQRTLMLSLLGVFVFALTGCESKLTRRNFEMVKKGTSTKLEVQHTLGEDYDVRGDKEWEYEDAKRHLSVFIYFDDNGKVLRKEWISGESGEWDGAAPNIDENPEGKEFSTESSEMTLDKD